MWGAAIVGILLAVVIVYPLSWFFRIVNHIKKKDDDKKTEKNHV